MKKKKEKKKLCNILKKVGVTLSILIVLLGVSFILYKGYNNIHQKNITNLAWLQKHVNIIEDSSLGNNIYSVSKSKDINIYNANYLKVIKEKVNDLLEQETDFDDAAIIYNPYGTNILSFNVYFHDEEEVNMSYTISVEDDNISDFTRTLYQTDENHHDNFYQYQLIGFVPGYINTLKLEIEDENGKVKEKKIKVDLTKIDYNSEVKIKTTDGKSKEELSEGLYTILGNDSNEDDYVSFYDNDGILRGETPIIGYRAHAILFQNNKMYFSISQTRIAEINNLGQVENIYRTGKYLLHHDYTFDNDGNLLVLANNTEKDTEEDCIIKINLETKEVEEMVDMENLFTSYVKTCKLDTVSIRDEGEDGLDWLHLNSIEYVDGDVILSSRETSSIIKVKNLETDPQINYILSDPALWENTDYKDYVYEKIGDFKIHAGQHSVRYKETDEKGVYYLTFFDNNYGKQMSQPKFDYSKIGITNTNPFKGDNSYYYVYKVNENEKTFELADSFDVIYSGIVSSAQTMDNNNIVIDSGTTGIFAEYDENHNLIRNFKVTLNTYMAYRVLKYDFNNFWFQI